MNILWIEQKEGKKYRKKQKEGFSYWHPPTYYIPYKLVMKQGVDVKFYMGSEWKKERKKEKRTKERNKERNKERTLGKADIFSIWWKEKWFKYWYNDSWYRKEEWNNEIER